MSKESSTAGFYESTLGTKHPKIQLFTIKELIDGKTIDYPRSAIDVTFKKAVKIKNRNETQEEF